MKLLNNVQENIYGGDYFFQLTGLNTSCVLKQLLPATFYQVITV